MPAAAIKATFHTARPVPSRGVVSFIFDVPTEQATAALDVLGGFPSGGDAVWVGIALLVPEKKAPPLTKPYAERDPGNQAVTRAGILCTDPAFHAWLGATDDDGAAQMVRDYCGVDSRRKIASNVEALDKFLKLESDFKRRAPYEATP